MFMLSIDQLFRQVSSQWFCKMHHLKNIFLFFWTLIVGYSGVSISNILSATLLKSMDCPQASIKTYLIDIFNLTEKFGHEPCKLPDTSILGHGTKDD